MGGFIDFTPLRNPGYFDEFLDPVVSAAKDAAEARRAREKQQADIAAAKGLKDQQLTFEREQETRLGQRDDDRFNLGQQRQDRLEAEAKRAAAAQEKRFVGERTMKNQDARAARDKAIQDAVGAGDLATAERLSRYQEQDPTTGDVQETQRFARVQPSPPPQMPTLEDAGGPNMVGPRMTPDIAERADILTSGLETDAEPGTDFRDAQAKQQAFDEARQRNTAAQDQYATAQSEYQQQLRNPRVRIGDVETTQGDVRYAKGRQNLVDFDQQGEVLKAQAKAAYDAGDPFRAAQAERRLEEHAALRPAVEAGGVDLRTAEGAINKAGVRADTQAFTHSEGGLRDTNRLDVQRLKNQAPRSSFTIGKANVDVKEQAAGETAIQNFQRNWQVSNQRFDRAKLQVLADNPDAPIAQRAIASVLSRQLAGEKGVLTDQDINRLQANLAGIMPDIENWFSKKGTGQLAPEILAEMKRGINFVIGERVQMDNRAKKAFTAKFLRSSSPYAKQGLGEYMRNSYEEIFGEPAPGIDSDTRPAGGGPRAGGAGPSLTPQQRQQIIDKLRARGILK